MILHTNTYVYIMLLSGAGEHIKAKKVLESIVKNPHTLKREYSAKKDHMTERTDQKPFSLLLLALKFFLSLPEPRGL